MSAATPPDEAQRLAELRRYRVLDTPAERAFERVTSLTSRALDVPIALISLVDERRQWFKACIGLDTRETSREVSFCAHAILSGDVFVVPDAAADTRFVANPLVTGAPHIRAYAGAPLTTSTGHRLGTLCAIDTRPRAFTTDQQVTLAELAAVVVDELELRLARDEHEAQTRVLLAILDSAGEGIAVTDDANELVFFNPAAQRMLGYTARDVHAREELGRRGVFYPDGTTPFPVDAHPSRRALRGEPTDHVEMCLRREGSADIHISATGRPIVDEHGAINGSVITFADITALRLARDELARQATTDGLTGIANHRVFRQRLDLLVAEGQRGRRFALVMIDVDHFKRLNDEHGHPVGDRVLVAIAGRLAARVRKTDLAARYGGEEFAVLLTDLDGDQAETIAGELRAAIAALEVPGFPGRVTASFGLAVYAEPMDGGALLAAADAALYLAKRGGRDRVVRAAEPKKC